MEQLIQLKIQTWKVDELKYEHRGAPGSSVWQGAELPVTLGDPGAQGWCHRHYSVLSVPRAGLRF